MKTVNELHDKAMDLAEYAFVAKIRRNLSKADELFRQAFEYESQAARLVPDDPSYKLTRSVLYRSAATLALDCNKPNEAEQLVAEGLAGNPPPEIKRELIDLYNKIHKNDVSVEPISTKVQRLTQVAD